MRILVPVKRVIDPNIKIRLKADGSGVDMAGTKMTMNPFDEIAIEGALRLREAGLAREVIAITVGPGAASDTLRGALATGADRAIHVVADQRVEPLGVARVLEAVIRAERADLVIMGKQAIDDDMNATGQMLAARMGWPQGTFASALSVKDGEVRVTREVDGGLEKLALALPAIITVDLRLNEPRYASLPNIMKAKKKPIEVKPAADFGLDLSSRLEVMSVTAPPVRASGVRVNSVGELADRIRQIAGAAQ